MFKAVRVIATIIFLASIVLVFVGAFVIGSDVRSGCSVSSSLRELILLILDSVH